MGGLSPRTTSWSTIHPLALAAISNWTTRILLTAAHHGIRKLTVVTPSLLCR